MPSFTTDSPLDIKIKRGLVSDVFKTLCLSYRRKKAYKDERAARMQERLLKPKNVIRLQENLNKDEEDKNK